MKYEARITITLADRVITVDCSTDEAIAAVRQCCSTQGEWLMVNNALAINKRHVLTIQWTPVE